MQALWVHPEMVCNVMNCAAAGAAQRAGCDADAGGGQASGNIGGARPAPRAAAGTGHPSH
jgi:hypothetical protein